jgi:uncharacterized protein (TIGR02147 family)
MTQIYSFIDYRAFLRKSISAATQRDGGWGGITRWTAAVGCQRSHGSRVLNGEKDLNPDQALATAQFLELSEAETDYFLTMVDYARAATKPLRDRLHKKLKDLVKEQQIKAIAQQHPRIGSTNEEALYFSAWYWSAIHVMTSIPGFSTPAKIATRLGLPMAVVESVLNELATLGFVKKQGSHWSYGTTSYFLPKNAAMISVHHASWRQKAVQDAQLMQGDGFHYTVVQSISVADIEKFRTKLNLLVEEYQRIALPSAPEELVSFCCDFFRV